MGEEGLGAQCRPALKLRLQVSILKMKRQVNVTTRDGLRPENADEEPNP
jgi:hypothetical protein